MDYDKLIEDMKTYKTREEKPLVREKAVFAIKTFRAEINKLRADLARVTAERDAAVDDLTFAVNKYRLFTTDINLCYLCKFNFTSSGENEQTYECPGCYGDDCFEWRGPQKED